MWYPSSPAGREEVIQTIQPRPAGRNEDAMIFTDKKTANSGDHTSTVVFSAAVMHAKHKVMVKPNGSPTAGTFSIAVDGQTISGTISATSPTPVIFEGPCDAISVVPAGFDGSNFDVTVWSWQ